MNDIKKDWEQIEEIRSIIWDHEHLGSPIKIANVLWDAGYRKGEDVQPLNMNAHGVAVATIEELTGADR